MQVDDLTSCMKFRELKQQIQAIDNELDANCQKLIMSVPQDKLDDHLSFCRRVCPHFDDYPLHDTTEESYCFDGVDYKSFQVPSNCNLLLEQAGVCSGRCNYLRWTLLMEVCSSYVQKFHSTS